MQVEDGNIKTMTILAIMMVDKAYRKDFMDREERRKNDDVK